MKVLKSIRRVLDTAEMAFFTVFALVLVGVTVLAVIVRYCFRSPFAWCEEVQMILVVWLAFSGASIALREHGHIAIDLLTNAFPKRVQEVIEAVVWVLVMVALCWITKLEYSRTLQLYTTVQATTILKIPKYLNYGMITVLSVCMVANHLFNGIEGIAEWRANRRDK